MKRTDPNLTKFHPPVKLTGSTGEVVSDLGDFGATIVSSIGSIGVATSSSAFTSAGVSGATTSGVGVSTLAVVASGVADAGSAGFTLGLQAWTFLPGSKPLVTRRL